MDSSIQNIWHLRSGRALEMAYTIPAPCTWTSACALENQQVFGSNWIAVGRTDRRRRGQFFTFDLAGEPLVIVRGATTSSAPFSTSAATMRPPWPPRPAAWPSTYAARTMAGPTVWTVRSKEHLSSPVFAI